MELRYLLVSKKIIIIARFRTKSHKRYWPVKINLKKKYVGSIESMQYSYSSFNYILVQLVFIILCSLLLFIYWHYQLLRTTEYARYEKAQWESTWRHALISDYTDENISRQLFFLKQLGKSALNQTELSQVINGFLVQLISL